MTHSYVWQDWSTWVIRMYYLHMPDMTYSYMYSYMLRDLPGRWWNTKTLCKEWEYGCRKCGAYLTDENSKALVCPAAMLTMRQGQSYYGIVLSTSVFTLYYVKVNSCVIVDSGNHPVTNFLHVWAIEHMYAIMCVYTLVYLSLYMLALSPSRSCSLSYTYIYITPSRVLSHTH